MIDINIISVGLGIICTLIGVGWKIANVMQDIKISVVRIEVWLQATSVRLDKIENDLDDCQKEIKQINKVLNYDE